MSLSATCGGSSNASATADAAAAESHAGTTSCITVCHSGRSVDGCGAMAIAELACSAGVRLAIARRCSGVRVATLTRPWQPPRSGSGPTQRHVPSPSWRASGSGRRPLPCAGAS